MTAAHLSQLEAYLGRKETLAPLLQEVRARPAHGSAAELISESSSCLADMLTIPELAFKFGPSALSKILTVKQTADVARSRNRVPSINPSSFGLNSAEKEKVCRPH
jgi:hypothetical protein